MKTHFMLGVSAVALGTFIWSPIAETLSDHHQHPPRHDEFPHQVVPYGGMSANSSNTFAVALGGVTVVYDTTIPREYEVLSYLGSGARVILELTS